MIAKQAEIYVRNGLKKKGWQVLKERYRRVATEIDLIVSKGHVLSFVEVKYRKVFLGDNRYLQSLVPLKKKQALLRGAMHFITENNQQDSYTLRFDLAVVTIDAKHQVFQCQYFADFFSADSLLLTPVR